MDKILFINACVRPDSRTYRLARAVLSLLEGRVEEVNLEKENIQPLNSESLQRREAFIVKGDFSDSMFKYAKQFAEADVIVVAAPFWDMSFPASVKIYIEAVTVTGLTFEYTPEGIPAGLCRGRRLIYVTTAGGSVFDDNFGFKYVKTMAEVFYGIKETVCFKAQNLDVEGADAEKILKNAEAEIRKNMI